MKTILLNTTLLLGIVALVGCGKSETGADVPEKTLQQPVVSSKIICSTEVPMRQIGGALAQEYRIFLNRKTVDAVLIDIRANNDFKLESFWNDLSPKVRDQLNYDLNLVLLTRRVINHFAVYQSVAYYFAHNREMFSDLIEYKVRDDLNGIYSYSVKGQRTETVEVLSLDCQTDKGTDLKRVNTPVDILRATEIKDIIWCNTLDAKFTITEIRNNVLIESDGELFRLPSESLKREVEGSKRVKLSINTTEVSMNLDIKRNRDVVRDFTTRPTQLDLRLPNKTISGTGVCSSLKRSL